MSPWNPHHEPDVQLTEVSDQIANSSGVVSITAQGIRVIRDVWVEFTNVLGVTDMVVAQVYAYSGNKVDVIFLRSGGSGLVLGAMASADISGGTIAVYARGDR